MTHQCQIYLLQHSTDATEQNVIMDAYTTPDLAHAAAQHHAQCAFESAGPGATLVRSMSDTIQLWIDGARVEQWIYFPIDLDKMPC